MEISPVLGSVKGEKRVDQADGYSEGSPSGLLYTGHYEQLRELMESKSPLNGDAVEWSMSDIALTLAFHRITLGKSGAARLE